MSIVYVDKDNYQECLTTGAQEQILQMYKDLRSLELEKASEKELDEYDPTVQPETFADFLIPYWAPEASTHVVAILDETEGTVISTARLTFFNDNELLVMTSVSTNPQYRNQGYAKSLIEQIVVDYKEKGIKELSLTVGIWNTPAQALYRSVGFSGGQILMGRKVA